MVEVCARCVTLTISRDRACPAEGPISLAGMCAGLTYCIDQNPGVFGCIRMTINYCNFCLVLFASAFSSPVGIMILFCTEICKN